jgi:hypothetical protein
MKKLISIILALVLACGATVTAFAAQNTDPRIGNYKFLETVEIPNNYAYIYTYGDNSDKYRRLNIEEVGSNFVYTHYFSSASIRLALPLSNENGYHVYSLIGNESASTGGMYSGGLKLSNTGGTYQKVRIKLSAFSSYFNEDGTVTNETIAGGTHDYNFTNEDGKYISSLVFFSGGAITAAVPDKNGCVEIYISTNVGQVIEYTTSFMEINNYQYASVGGTSGNTLCGLTIGDTDKTGYTSIADVTLIQKYIVKQESFDELQLRNADTDFDGTIDIADATIIQKQLAKIK